MRSKVFAILALSAISLVAVSAPSMATPGPDHKEFFCHATGSKTNPYVAVNVDKASQHKNDPDDLFSGPIVDAGCKVVVPTPQPTVTTPAPSPTATIPAPTPTNSYSTDAPTMHCSPVPIPINIPCPVVPTATPTESLPNGHAGGPDCQEDQPCWNCQTMGNHICGPVEPTAAPSASSAAPAATGTPKAPASSSSVPVGDTPTPVATELAMTGADAPWIMPVGLAALVVLALGVALQIFSKRARRH